MAAYGEFQKLLSWPSLLTILDFVSSPTVCDALSASPMEHKKLITWDDLAHEDIFIRIDQSSVSQWSSLIRLMLVQVIKTLERRPEKFTPEGRQIEPTLLMLDEFPQYGQVRELTSAMKVLRSKKVTFALFCQSFADLEETYGATTRKTIVDNCPYLAILGAQDADTSKCLSEMIGKYKTLNGSVSYRNYMYDHAQNDSFSLTETERPVIPPEEFRTLKDIILLNPYGYGFCRVEKDTWFQREPQDVKNEEKGGSYMETSIDKRLNNAENKVRYLEDQKKRAKKAEEELNKKREAHVCFLIGQQLICHFPQLLEDCMGGSEARENALKRLDYMLDALSSDSAALENLKEKAQEMDLLFSKSQDEICEEPDEM